VDDLSEAGAGQPSRGRSVWRTTVRVSFPTDPTHSPVTDKRAVASIRKCLKKHGVYIHVNSK